MQRVITKKILLASLILALSFTLWAIYFVMDTLSESGVDKKIGINPNFKELPAVWFEEGGLLKKNEFDFYRSLSADLRFKTVIYKNLTEVQNNILEIEEDFKLQAIRRNTCKLNRCLQFEIPFSKIPTITSHGLIGIEDYRFLDHFGIDLVSIARAIVKDIQAGALVQGGSTLTQQLVKNLFFTNEKKLTRKIKEAILSIYIELKFEKDQILEKYFNEVFWGSLGGIQIKGIQAASVIYFGKDIEMLNHFESSILVSMLKGPYYYHPIRHTQRLVERANFIFNKLRELGLHGSKDDEKWTTKDWDNWVSRLKWVEDNNVMEAGYILSAKEEIGDEYLLYQSILSAKKVLKDKKEYNDNLSVKLLITSQRQMSYYSRFERDEKKAINEERHQIGSTIKPLLYNIFLKHDKKMTENVSAKEITLDLKSGKWTPRESHKILEEEVTLATALQESFNNPIIRISNEIGFDLVEKDFEILFPDMNKPLREYPAQLIGSVEISLSRLNDIYQSFFKEECQRPEHEILDALSDFSKTTVRRTVNEKLRPFKIFGKTGTTNNGFDNWYVGFDGKTTMIVWTGVEQGRKSENMLPLYGSNTSFKIFEEAFLYSGRRPGATLCP